MFIVLALSYWLLFLHFVPLQSRHYLVSYIDINDPLYDIYYPMLNYSFHSTFPKASKKN